MSEESAVNRVEELAAIYEERGGADDKEFYQLVARSLLETSAFTGAYVEGPMEDYVLTPEQLDMIREAEGAVAESIKDSGLFLSDADFELLLNALGWSKSSESEK